MIIKKWGLYIAVHCIVWLVVSATLGQKWYAWVPFANGFVNLQPWMTTLADAFVWSVKFGAGWYIERVSVFIHVLLTILQLQFIIPIRCPVTLRVCTRYTLLTIHNRPTANGLSRLPAGLGAG